MINDSACQLFHTHLVQIWIPIPLYLDTRVIWSLTLLPIPCMHQPKNYIVNKIHSLLHLVVWGPFQMCLIINWLYLLRRIIWHFIHGHLDLKNVQNFENKTSHEFSYNLNVTLCTTWGLPKRGNLIWIFHQGRWASI
jgi:hypothetical protein